MYSKQSLDEIEAYIWKIASEVVILGFHQSLVSISGEINKKGIKNFSLHNILSCRKSDVQSARIASNSGVSVFLGNLIPPMTFVKTFA
jgi:hypothetical protein